MKKLFMVSVASACFAFYCLGQNSPPIKVKALKDNTNLRAKSALNAEVVGQVSANQELITRSMDEEWVEVVAPTNIDFWVLGDYVKEGVIVCGRKVNVRAGPGINFSIVGQLSNDAKVEVRGSYMDWIKVAPPEGCSLWVSRPLVEIMPAQPVKAQPVKQPSVDSASVRSAGVGVAAGNAVQPDARKPAAVEGARTALVTNMAVISRSMDSQPQEADKTTVVKPPKDLDLVPEIGQGQWKQYEGVLRTKNFLVRSPSDFRLVVYENGQPRTVCFIKGNRSQLNALLFRELIVSGRQYWVHRHRQPVLIPEKIVIK